LHERSVFEHSLNLQGLTPSMVFLDFSWLDVTWPPNSPFHGSRNTPLQEQALENHIKDDIILIFEERVKLNLERLRSGKNKAREDTYEFKEGLWNKVTPTLPIVKDNINVVTLELKV